MLPIKRYCYNRFQGQCGEKICRNKGSHPENAGNFLKLEYRALHKMRKLVLRVLS